MPESSRENPEQKQPYTVVCVIIPDTCTLVSQVQGYDANDAVENALNRYSSTGVHYYERGEVEVIGVFYGHVEFCALDDDFRFKWFQFPIVQHS